MNSFIWSVFPVWLLVFQVASAQESNGLAVIQAVINYLSLYNGTDLSQNIILNGADYLDAFYSKLCDNDTYYYKLAFLDNGLYFAVETVGFLRRKIDPSMYSDRYQCEGHYLVLNCTRMLQTSQCGSGNVVLQARYNVTSDFCNKTSIPLCLLQRQHMSITVNMTQPVTHIDITTLAHVVKTQSLNRTTRNAGARPGSIENLTTSLLMLATALLLMCLVSFNH